MKIGLVGFCVAHLYSSINKLALALFNYKILIHFNILSIARYLVFFSFTVLKFYTYNICVNTCRKSKNILVFR